MAKQPTITTVSSGYYSSTTLNANFTALQAAFDNFLSLDGETPNTMLADLDMGSQDILNANEAYVSSLFIGGTLVVPTDLALATTAANVSTADAGGYYASATVEASLQELFSSSLFTRHGEDETITGDWTFSGETTIGGTTPGAGTFSTLTASGDLLVDQAIKHTGDTDNTHAFGTDYQSFSTNGTLRMDVNNSGVQMGGANARITTILDEDDMASDSATALATQQSVKAYVDTTVAASSWTQIGTSEPTANDADVSFTGLSGNGYRKLKISGILGITTTGSHFTVQVRPTSGTWRGIFQTDITGGVDDLIVFDCEIHNFDGAGATNLIFTTGSSFGHTLAIDRSSNSISNAADPDVVTSFGYTSYSETYDEIRIVPSSGTIHGDTANERGVVLLEALT